MIIVNKELTWEEIVEKYPNSYIYYDYTRTEKNYGRIDKCFVIGVSKKTEKKKAIKRLKKDKETFEMCETQSATPVLGVVKGFFIKDGSQKEIEEQKPSKKEEKVEEVKNKYAVDWYSSYEVTGGLPTSDNLDDEKKDLYASVLANSSTNFSNLFEEAKKEK